MKYFCACCNSPERACQILQHLFYFILLRCGVRKQLVVVEYKF